MGTPVLELVGLGPRSEERGRRRPGARRKRASIHPLELPTGRHTILLQPAIRSSRTLHEANTQTPHTRTIWTLGGIAWYRSKSR